VIGGKPRFISPSLEESRKQTCRGGVQKPVTGGGHMGLVCKVEKCYLTGLIHSRKAHSQTKLVITKSKTMVVKRPASVGGGGWTRTIGTDQVKSSKGRKRRFWGKLERNGAQKKPEFSGKTKSGT